MTVIYKVYKTDGTINKVEKEGDEVELNHLYELIDCDIVEAVRFTDYKMFVDENGILKGRKVNSEGSWRWYEKCNLNPMRTQPLVGTVVEVIRGEMK